MPTLRVNCVRIRSS